MATEDAGYPYAIWIVNALRGLPTDEDIRKVYFWVCQRLARQIETEQAASKRKRRLQSLWRAQWYSVIDMITTSLDGDMERKPVFAIVQGHRFLWWDSLHDFDCGEEPLGRLFLAGHAGIATPSPLELRTILDEEKTRVISIFGKGRSEQEKISMVVPSTQARTSLEKAVTLATSIKSD